MSYWRECPRCGAALDPGEQCDCQVNSEASMMLSPTAPLATERSSAERIRALPTEERDVRGPSPTAGYGVPMRIRARDREEWLRLRKNGIGGSDAAAALGLSPWTSPLELWLQKTGQKTELDLSNNADVAEGVRMESPLRELFRAMHPALTVEHRPFDMIYQSGRPHSFSTLDGEYYLNDAPNERGILEIKRCMPTSRAKWEEWDGRVPQHYYIQILKQLGDTGYQMATLLAALIRQNGEILIREYTFRREQLEEDIAFVVDGVDRFWRCVQERRRPPVVLTM